MSTLAKHIQLNLLFARFKVSSLFLLAVILAFVCIAAASIGSVNIPLSAIVTGALNDQQEAVLFSIRFPRVVLAAIVGAALAVSGAALQGLFRNPLADPSLIGILSGAALAVAAVIVFAGPSQGYFGLYRLSIAAFTGGLVTSVLIFRFARLAGTFSVTYMLLAGIAIGAIAEGGRGFIAYLSDDAQLRALTFWAMGNLGDALWPAVLVVMSITIPATVILVRNARALNLLLLGENEARHLGVDAERLKYVIIICTALSVGAAVAVSGIIGFVGLVVPHLIRLTIGPDHRLLIPGSALLGAILLIIADTFARTVVSPAEMPVGIITSIIGGPFFLWLLIKQYSGRFGI